MNLRDYQCDGCQHYSPINERAGECRKRAPKLRGWPTVNHAWRCGEHTAYLEAKISEFERLIHRAIAERAL